MTLLSALAVVVVSEGVHVDDLIVHLLHSFRFVASIKKEGGIVFFALHRKMADCGATGSALDRVTRVLGGANGGGGAHGVVGLAGLLTTTTHHSSTTNPQAVLLLPSAPPEYLPQLSDRFQKPPPPGQLYHGEGDFRVPSYMMSTTTTPVGARILQESAPPAATTMQSSSSFQTANLFTPPQHQPQHHHQQAAVMMMMQQPPAMMMSPAAAMPHQHHTMMMQMQMQQQHAMMGAMLQQQQQMKQQREQQQQHQQQQHQQVGGVEGSARPVSIEELSQAWKEAVVTNTDTGEAYYDPPQQEQGTAAAKPASIEELSQAWWEANATEEQEGDWQTAVANELGDFYGLDEWGHPAHYQFHNQPPLSNINESIKDWWKEGMRHFTAGDLTEAIHAFEMELQLNSTDHAQAWLMLGRCHAEQDMDREAILCLEQSVEVDPYHVPSRLALGVSYVNELDHDKALAQLKAWVTHHPQLSSLTTTATTVLTPPMADIYGDGSVAQSPFEEVQQLLLHALENSINAATGGGQADHNTLADIYTALGVVYNVSRDYDAAIASFRAALSHRPANDDYQLYNKLGATMANHNLSDEALEQYRQALAIRPKYARAWLNTAISHANLQHYVEASTCYLQALTLNPAATHCWSYLRVSIHCAERDDLIPLVMERNLQALRSAFGMPNE
jgi:peroxin-5